MHLDDLENRLVISKEEFTRRRELGCYAIIYPNGKIGAFKHSNNFSLEVALGYRFRSQFVCPGNGYCGTEVVEINEDERIVWVEKINGPYRKS